ncbi:hypothetical protein KPI97_05905 [Escherichia coli]|nr:hypothetical protein [Escherichia coli]MBU3277156.1 hypothetical protein [Escherichia coli]MBU3282139.1 hypothetical protein [Escherichia coli]MBU3287109.1 hypothetical protein [Escherichia coli]MBU3292098.1 hypothetical protein [Escherichia coli]MBU3296790.1 hypothetical protein [Escherichia coli]
MSGKPAARQGDMTQYGGSIVQGSAGVRIGAPMRIPLYSITDWHRSPISDSHPFDQPGT